MKCCVVCVKIDLYVRNLSVAMALDTVRSKSVHGNEGILRRRKRRFVVKRRIFVDP